MDNNQPSHHIQKGPIFKVIHRILGMVPINYSRFFTLLTIVIVYLTTGGPLKAQVTYNFQLNYTQLGRLNQNNIPNATESVSGTDYYPGMACVPTSSANGIVYLTRHYASVYGTLLTDNVETQAKVATGDAFAVYNPTNGNLLSSANLMATAEVLQSYMGTDSQGTFYDDAADGLHTYIETHAPGRSIFSAQSEWGWNPLSGNSTPSWFNSAGTGSPTFSSLWDGLNNASAIQLGLTYGSGGGHMVSLYGVSWTDSDLDGMIDASESAKINIMDPWTGWIKTVGIWQNTAGGAMYTDYKTNTWISFEMTITAVPEPSTYAMMIMGVLLIALVLRNRQNKVA